MRRSVRSLIAVAAVTATLAIPGVAGSAASAAEPAWTPVAPAGEPDVNPLKGFIPFAGDFDDFPYSMEWSYFPLNAVMTGPDTFDWTTVDSALDQIAARGHQTALRFYLDYPTKPTGIPQYLLDGGLVTHAYDDYGNNGASVAPDYNDPALGSAIDSFVSALGKRYDGDARIGFLQAGLVGFWGEWHTYPYNGENGEPNWMASDETQARVLSDFVGAFHTTALEVRNPNAANASLPIGYHDDSFALETKQSSLGWHFMDNMVAAGAQDKWQKYSIGGELRPELQGCLFSSAGCAPLEDGGDNDFAGSVAETHVSWMIDHYAFATGYSGADKAAALAASKSIGYSFRVTEALVPSQTAPGQSTVGVTVANIGVAPFYYDWPITLGFVDSTGAVTHSQLTDWHVSDVASGASKQFTTTVDAAVLPAGDYHVVAQVTNPLGNGLPIRFANAAQDADANGWLTLGATSVAAATTPTSPAPTPAATTGAPSSESLAATGVETLPLVVASSIGVVALMGGFALLWLRRRVRS